jgi:DNA-binding SARP family transcriptional activator
MVCSDRLGRRSDIEQVYRECRDALATQLDVAPSHETRALRSQLCGKLSTRNRTAL